MMMKQYVLDKQQKILHKHRIITMLNVTPNEIPAEKSTTPVIESGTYHAIISLIVDLGMQKEKIFESKDKPDEACTEEDYKIGHQLWFSFTLPTERYEVEVDGEVFERDQVLGKQYKMSKSDKSNLIIMYKAVVKDGRNFGQMVGMPVTVTTGMTSGGNPKVMSVSSPMKGAVVAAPLVEPFIVDEGEWDNVDELKLPDFLKDMIKNRVQ